MVTLLLLFLASQTQARKEHLNFAADIGLDTWSHCKPSIDKSIERGLENKIFDTKISQKNDHLYPFDSSIFVRSFERASF